MTPKEVLHITDNGKRWATTTDIELATTIADAIKGQVFLYNPAIEPPKGLTLVYSYGERAVLSKKPIT